MTALGSMLDRALFDDVVGLMVKITRRETDEIDCVEISVMLRGSLTIHALDTMQMENDPERMIKEQLKRALLAPVYAELVEPICDVIYKLNDAVIKLVTNGESRLTRIEIEKNQRSAAHANEIY